MLFSTSSFLHYSTDILLITVAMKNYSSMYSIGLQGELGGTYITLKLWDIVTCCKKFV